MGLGRRVERVGSAGQQFGLPEPMASRLPLGLVRRALWLVSSPLGDLWINDSDAVSNKHLCGSWLIHKRLATRSFKSTDFATNAGILAPAAEHAEVLK